jgi:hypothetical protein
MTLASKSPIAAAHHSDGSEPGNESRQFDQLLRIREPGINGLQYSSSQLYARGDESKNGLSIQFNLLYKKSLLSD